VCNRKDQQTFEIAFEFDGKQHRLAKQARKDALKDRLCLQVRLPLLRVQSAYVEPLEDLTLLEYMLDLFFGERDLEELKRRGEVAEDEEYFIGTGFPATDRVIKRLLQKGIFPAGFMAFVENRYGPDEAQKIIWFRTSDKTLSTAPQRGSGYSTYRASSVVEVFRGPDLGEPLLKIEKEVNLKECSPNRDVLGIHTWHLALELANYLALAELEKLADRFGRRLRTHGRVQ
jgi:hypothetical protein